MSNPEVIEILNHRAAAAAELVTSINNMAEKFAALDLISTRAIDAAGLAVGQSIPRQFAKERLQHMVLVQLSSHATPAAWGRYDQRYNSTGQERASSLQGEIDLQNTRLLDHLDALATA